MRPANSNNTLLKLSCLVIYTYNCPELIPPDHIEPEVVEELVAERLCEYIRSLLLSVDGENMYHADLDVGPKVMVLQVHFITTWYHIRHVETLMYLLLS